MSDSAPRLRLDKWLWYARFFKTRSLATKTVSDGGVRVNGVRVTKPSASVQVGDGLTFSQGDWVRIVHIKALGTRRGPAPEAQMLFEDASPPRPEKPPRAPKFEGGGRPTKKDRRALTKPGLFDT
ncbi:MAG: RNA-binding S4 domain-containing protein [Pseudomonadota bacterium]